MHFVRKAEEMSMFPPRPPKKKPKRGDPPPKPFKQARPKKRIDLDEAMKLMEEGVTRSSELAEQERLERPPRRLICE
jgi:hypothetical protein